MFHLETTQELYLPNYKIIKWRYAVKRGLAVEKEISDVSVAQLVRAVDWQSKDLGSYPGTVGCVSFFTERFQILEKK